jgi:hydrogenase maturation protein HypF
MAACMAENGLIEDAIGVIYDGTGLGTDGSIWGGEILVGSKSKFSRVGHWKYVTLQGGDSAVREPWKSAVSYLYSIGVDIKEFLSSVERLKVKTIENAISNNINCFKSSSVGRLFDCISALVIRRTHITYDAQAAIELESVIKSDVSDFYPYSIEEKEEHLEIGYEEILSSILRDMKDGKTPSYISAKFHNTVCKATIDCVCKVRNKYCINNIVLSGGVFENVYLLSSMKRGLKEHGFHVYHNMKIPTNDGGIAFGQAVAAVQMVKETNYELSSKKR